MAKRKESFRVTLSDEALVVVDRYIAEVLEKSGMVPVELTRKEAIERLIILGNCYREAVETLSAIRRLVT